MSSTIYITGPSSLPSTLNIHFMNTKSKSEIRPKILFFIIILPKHLPVKTTLKNIEWFIVMKKEYEALVQTHTCSLVRSSCGKVINIK